MRILGQAAYSRTQSPQPADGHEQVTYAGEALVLGYRFWNDRWRLNEVQRLEEADGRITRIRGYCWTPDTLRFIAGALNLPVLTDAEGLAEAVQKWVGARGPSPTGGYRSP